MLPVRIAERGGHGRARRRDRSAAGLFGDGPRARDVPDVDEHEQLGHLVEPPQLERLLLLVHVRSMSEAQSRASVGRTPQREEEETWRTLIGFDDPGLGAPSDLVAGRLPSASGEAVGSDADASAGFGLGDTVTIEPNGPSLTVVGLARDVQLNAGPTLFLSYADYVAAVKAVNPDAGTPLPNVLAVAPAAGVGADELVANINARSADLDALTRSDAAGSTPGVSQVRQSFQIIFLLYGLVIPCVTGLFFLIVTFQKSRALTLLRAIGAPARRLIASLLLQAAIIVGAGFLTGLALYAPVSQLRLGGIPLRFETRAVIVWAAVLLVLGIGSSIVAARRVLSIDPIEATTGGGNR